MIATEDILQAYFDCRKNKRRTASATVYEMDYETLLIGLRDRINARTYAPGKSICFVVTRPIVVLRADALNMEVLRLLMTQYTVIVERTEKEIILELYPM